MRLAARSGLVRKAPEWVFSCPPPSCPRPHEVEPEPTPPCLPGNPIGNASGWRSPSLGHCAIHAGEGRSGTAANMSHHIHARMSERSAVAIGIVVAFLVGTVAPVGSPHTICTDCPSGAAATVSHNRPVRMSESLTVAIGTVSLVDTVAPDSDLGVMRKDCPSGAAATVSHNRPVRMSSDQNGGERRGQEKTDPRVTRPRSQRAASLKAAGVPERAARRQPAGGRLNDGRRRWRVKHRRAHAAPLAKPQTRECEAPAGSRCAACQAHCAAHDPGPESGIVSPALRLIPP